MTCQLKFLPDSATLESVTNGEVEMVATRSEKGRFVKGGPAGPGRPKRTDYTELLRATLTKEDATEIFKKAIHQAKEGNHAARSWVCSFLMSPAPKTLKLEHEEQTDARRMMDAIVAVILEAQLVEIQKVMRDRKE